MLARNKQPSLLDPFVSYQENEVFRIRLCALGTTSLSSLIFLDSGALTVLKDFAVSFTNTILNLYLKV